MPPREITREAYAAIYISAPWHPKVLALPEEDRAAAFGYWCASLVLCQAYRNDGEIPRAQLPAVFACPESERDRLVRLLVDVGLYEDAGHVLRVHDYLDHNRSRDEIESAHERMRKGGRKGGKASPKKGTSPPLKPTLEGSPEQSRDSSEETSRDEQSREEACAQCGQTLTAGECWACSSDELDRKEAS